MTTQVNNNAKQDVLYIGIELSASKWVLSFRTSFTKCRNKAIDAWDVVKLTETICDMKKRFELAEQAIVKSCYEAGQDGFSVHRQLQKLQIENSVVDSASIETNRRKKHLKTDRIDGEKLSAMLLRYDAGDKNLWRVARIPSEQEEDLRRTHRELDVLKKESTAHRNRMRMLLKLHGVKIKNVGGPKWSEKLDTLRTWDGKSIPERLMSELKRENDRLLGVQKQIKEIDAYQLTQLKEADISAMKKVNLLKELRGIGYKSAWILVMEWFGWRTFNNVKEVGAAAGLVGVRRSSGSMSQDQGISKIGSPQIRTLLVELAWSWLRYQPEHPLSLWFKERFGGGGARLRRIGIVALARKLIILLWKYVSRGELFPGTLLKATEV